MNPEDAEEEKLLEVMKQRQEEQRNRNKAGESMLSGRGSVVR